PQGRSQVWPQGYRSGLPFGLEHGRGQGLAAVLARPDDELEGLVVALTSLERGAEQGLALALGGDGAVEHEALTEHDQTFARPNVEMSEPKLLVDLRDETIDFREPVVGHLEVEGAGDMQ